MNNWRLPNKEELNLMYELHKKGIGDFTDVNYWSSSEFYAYYAWSQYFYDGYRYYFYKSYPLRVRAVRSFQSNEDYQIGEKTETGIVFDKNESEYKECKFKDEVEHHTWHDAMKLFE